MHLSMSVTDTVILTTVGVILAVVITYCLVWANTQQTQGAYSSHNFSTAAINNKHPASRTTIMIAVQTSQVITEEQLEQQQNSVV